MHSSPQKTNTPSLSTLVLAWQPMPTPPTPPGSSTMRIRTVPATQSQTSARSPGTNNNHNITKLLRYSKNKETSPVFPSLFVGIAAAPSNHGAAAPQCHAQAVSHWTFGCCHRFDRLEGRNERGRKIVQRGGRGGMPGP